MTSLKDGKRKVSSLNREQLLYFMLFAGLWLYVWLRAVFTQLTHDETANFFRFVHTGDFLPYGIDTSATNHLLNSFLTWIFYSLFGAEPVVLRLGNVLFFPVFFYFLVRFAGFMQNRFLRIGFVVVVAMMHNFLEFFAMSRGYGQSMALLLGALWFLVQSFQKPTARNYFFTLLFAAFALAANLTLLNSVILVIGFLMLRLLLKHGRSIRETYRQWLIILLFGIGPLIFFAAYLFYLKAIGDLYYGQASGFWGITVRTLITTMLNPGGTIIEIFVAIYLVAVLIAGLYLVFKKSVIDRLFDSGMVFFWFLVGNVIAVLLLNKLFGVNYPEDRTGLYFLIYFTGSIFFFADQLATDFKQKLIQIAVVPLFIFPVHFIISLNLDHNSFENQAIPSRFYTEMLNNYTPGEVPPTVGGYRGRELRWAFLNFSRGGKLGKVQQSIYPDTLCDFQIADTSFPAAYRKLYNQLDFYQNSDFALLKRKQAASVSLVFENNNIRTADSISDLYYRFFIIDVDSLAGKFVRIDFNIDFNTQAKPFYSWLVANALNAENQQTGYEYIALDWLKTNWQGENDRVINSIIMKLPDDIHKLNFYLWNKRQVPFSVDGGRVKVWVYE